ncbi:MAG: NAD(P)-dependent oxidoreductase [Pseudomonadota bacterium]
MTERVLVTGATGFLGGAVLRRLGAQGIGQGRDPARLAALQRDGLDTFAWALPEVLSDTQAASLCDVGAIVHAAGLSSPFGPRAAFQRANVAGTQAVIDLARRLGVARFVLISSPSVYFALADQLNMSEDAPLPRPFTPYAESKAQAEALVRAAGDLGPVILRPRGLYGPGDTALLPRLMRAAKTRALPRFRDGVAKIDLTYIDDCVDAVMAALRVEAAAGATLNISGGEVLSVSDIVTQTCGRAGVTPRWKNVPLGPALMAARLAETVALLRPGQPEPAVTRYGLGLFAFEQSLDISRAQGVLGWTPKVPLAEGLERVFAEAPS